MRIQLFAGGSASADGRPIAVGGPRQRAVLVMLASRPRRAVPVERLVDGLWAGEPPPSAVKTVRAYLSRLRAGLGAGVVRSTQAGYLLDVEDTAVDGVAFEAAVHSARATAAHDPGRTAATLRSVLARCQPPVHHGLHDCPGAAEVLRRLEEERVLAVELLMELEVAAGHAEAVIPELSQLVAEHPYRERLWASLMRALYQAGRQSDALAAFQQARTTLRDDLGLEPGPALRELEAAILTHDPALASPVSVPAMPRHLVGAGTGTRRAAPHTDYARTADGLHIAYQVIGDGPIDLVFFGPPLSHIELAWDQPRIAAFYESLASFSRLILFDKRGVGMSDPVTGAATVEQRMDDVRAVMDAAGSERAVMFGTSEGAQVGVLLATTYPERVEALAFYSTFACVRRGPDYPIGVPDQLHETFLELVDREWGGRAFVELVIPSLLRDAVEVDRFCTYARHAASPGSAVAQFRMNFQNDVRHLLPSVSVPTVVMHAANERFIRADHSRYLAAHIPGARYVEFPGADHLPYGDNAGRVVKTIEALLPVR